MAALDGDGAASDGLIEITVREQIFEFRDVPAPPTPSLLRGFSAPVRLTISLDPDQIEFLMMHDKDDFNRWHAAQTYATNLLTAAARDGGADPSRVTGKEAARLAHALSSTTADAALAPAYRPSSSNCRASADIARELARHVDTDDVRNAREALRATIAGLIGADLDEVYEAIAPKCSRNPLRALPNHHAELAFEVDPFVAAGPLDCLVVHEERRSRLQKHQGLVREGFPHLEGVRAPVQDRSSACRRRERYR